MDWDKLKETEDKKRENKERFEVLTEQWTQLNEIFKGKHAQFESETKPAKDILVRDAIIGFKNYFESKGFTVIGDDANLNAEYNDVKIIFDILDKY